MTPKEFQNTVVETNWYDKYYYYLISVGAIIGSLYLFHDIATNPLKYRVRHSYGIALMAFSFLFLIGCYAIYLIPNRYKVLTVSSGLSVDKKKEIISKLLNKLGVVSADINNGFYSFRFQRNWWTSDYDVYLFIDNQNFYVSVLGTTHAYPASGFIDLGGTQRLRKKVFSIIQSLTNDE